MSYVSIGIVSFSSSLSLSLSLSFSLSPSLCLFSVAVFIEYVVNVMSGEVGLPRMCVTGTAQGEIESDFGHHQSV